MTTTTSRRAALTGLAGLAVSPALAMPVINVPKDIDPIYAAIEKHRRLTAESEAICLEAEKIESELPHGVLDMPCVPTFPIRGGKFELIEKTEDYQTLRYQLNDLTGEMDHAHSIADLRKEAKTIPAKHRSAWFADRSAALKREQDRIDKILNESGYTAISERRSSLDVAEYNAGQELITTRPTTLEGIAALAIYVSECTSADYSLMPDGDDRKIVLQNIAAALRAQMPTLKVDAGPERGGRRGA